MAGYTSWLEASCSIDNRVLDVAEGQRSNCGVRMDSYFRALIGEPIDGFDSQHDAKEVQPWYMFDASRNVLCN